MTSETGRKILLKTDKINTEFSKEIDEAKKEALEVLLHNAQGPFHGLPRTAGWGYPEPYTRDLMISILGIASPLRANQMISWIEDECVAMKEKGELNCNLPPNFFPFTKPGDPDWHERYFQYNNPGDYHNGVVWSFISGFYIAALVAAKRFKLA